MGQVLTRHPRRGRRETPYVHFGPQFHCWPACHERHTQTIGLWASDLGELFHDSSPCPNGIDIPVEDPSALCGGKREKDMANSPPAPGFGNPTPPLNESKDSHGIPLWMQEAERAAKRHCTILITGETGVGKGHLANHIHRQSPRADRPFVPINCGAIPETLMDSQLFGHAKGAFSDARREHPGMIRAAEGGTIFLDEIGELTSSAQIRMLRLLQEFEVQPVGYSEPVEVNVRVLSATNRSLEDAVSARSFREDLLYRLDVIRVEVPPLRQRRNEIRGLIQQFNEEFCRIHRTPTLDFHPEAIESLIRHPWPGNIRQLRTVIERLHVLCESPLVTPKTLRTVSKLDLIDSSGISSSARFDLPAHRKQMVEVHLEQGGTVESFAKGIGVHRSTVYRWLKPS